MTISDKVLADSVHYQKGVMEAVVGTMTLASHFRDALVSLACIGNS
jgi:hypothetical protein